MTNNPIPLAVGAEFRSLPEFVFTKDGMAFRPADSVWVLTDGSLKMSLRFAPLPLTESMLYAYKMVLIWYAENSSLSYLRNLFYHVSKLLDFLSPFQGTVDQFTATDILNYKAKIGKKNEWYVGTMAGLLKKWHGMALPGVTDDVLLLLSQLTLKGNEKGTATATMDPLKGPLTVIEMEGLQLALNIAYQNKNVEIAEYVLCWLFFALGQRPKQYAAMKVCDVRCEKLKDGTFQYELNMPRAKQRGGGIRSEFKERVLSAELGNLVYRYAQTVKKDFETILENSEQAPLFPTNENRGVPGLEFHEFASKLGNNLRTTLDKLSVKSERTGEPIKNGAKRFRQTIGTRAAEEGHGALVIAELLDHSDTANVQVYVGTTTAMADRIDRAMAMHLAPLAQAFAGKLIDDRSQALRAFDPHNVILAPEITNSFDGISSCGKDGFCGFAKPIACYTCSNFEPWLDGPHEEVLAYLLANRERLIPIDSRIATINDRMILAVAEVIQLCEVFRNDRYA